MPNRAKPSQKKQFQQEAERKRSNILFEFLAFLRHNKKWWMLPIVLILLIMGLLILLGGTALAPFLYPLF